MTSYIRRRQQRGVILLAIISLLTMFMLIGITYVVVSGHFKRAAVTNSRVRQLEVPPQKHLDGAMYQLLRDTDFAGSVVRGHSLLQDKYGHWSVQADVVGWTKFDNKTEQILDMTIKKTSGSVQDASELTGRVITFLDDSINISGHILHAESINANIYKLQILLRDRSENISALTSRVAQQGRVVKILINGRDFSGTGFGLEYANIVPNTISPSPLEPVLPKPPVIPLDPLKKWQITTEALWPNRAADTKEKFEAFRFGGANEGYDVPDYQNMALAAQLSDPTTRQLQYVIPSFHRPALINYWEMRLANRNPAQAATIMNKIVMRPRKEEHTDFTGSNPTFDPINGPWDVDNDGDGIRDSIWIDMGFPIQTDSSGRQYKPLFAVLCLDMDGRLNLNAHGNEIHHLTNDARGMGYGPAEIKLAGLYESSPDDYLKLLMGDARTPGRYGDDKSPGKSGFDPLSNFIFGRFPDNFVNAEPNTSFQYMPDIHGELEYRINESGNVIYQAPINRTTGKLRIMNEEDNPYEVNPVSPNAADQLFNAHEMEALLRYHDPDNPQFNNSHPPQPPSWTDGSSRLYQLTKAFNGNGNHASANRRSVTTASFDPPVPSIQIPKESRTETTETAGLYNKRSASFRELLKSLLRAQGVPNNNLDNVITHLKLNPKFFSGLKMDVNQPFGDGLDNNNDGVVDNPIESSGQYLYRRDYARNLYIMMLLMKDKDRIIDFNGDGTATTDETHRYIAQWAVNVVDFRDADSIMTPFEFDLKPFNLIPIDGIMPSPDDGHPERALVWGTERPELLITESLAFHDRRTEDLDIDEAVDTDTFQDMDLNANAGRPDADLDNDFDQRLLPNSGVFFELYNPWQSIYEGGLVKGSNRPTEFHQNRGLGRAGIGVRLDQLSKYGDPVGKRSPVWRMIIVRDDDKRRDPDAWDEDEVPWDLTEGKLTIERAIYFVDGKKPLVKIPDADTKTDLKDITERFFYSPNDPNNLDLQPKPLGPGQYAVIGSGTYNQFTNKYPTYIGRSYQADEALHGIDTDNDMQDDTWAPDTPPATNKIELDPASNNVVHIPINYHYARSTPDNPVGNPEEKSLSITEPVFGYRDRINQNKFPTSKNNVGEPILATMRDQPLDDGLSDPITENSRLALRTKGTTNDFAAVHLQRLANPLKPHNKNTNPYRTIDTASVDVTTFNGVYKKTVGGVPVSPKDSDPNLVNGVVRFNSLERGWGDINNGNMLWKQEIARQRDGPATVENEDSEHIFRYDLTLLPPGANGVSLGRRNDSYPAGYFPWLQWNNRPFVSQLELMMVPRSSSSQLLNDYSFNNSADNWNPYEVPNGDNPNAAYGHLLNFFESGSGSTNFHRLFDYTEVQSYFTGAQTYYFKANLPTSSAIRPDGLDPPFKRITNYRDPGRINLNTIFDPVVFAGLMNGHENNPTGPNYADWFDSRRAWKRSKNYYPTYFANPIRPAGSGDMVPPIEPLPSDYIKPDGTTQMSDLEKLAEFRKSRHRALLKQPDVEVSLLRNKRNALKKHLPLFSTGYTEDYRNPIRNPTFEYQSLQRLGNLTTGRSNVYSVWITVGYFEVTPKEIRKFFLPTGNNDVNLTGYQLGAEVGIDRGQVKRHRAFYMIDRSIPVAFEPGENHNVDKAVILRRYVD